MTGVGVKAGWIRAILLRADVPDRTGAVYSIEMLREISKQSPDHLWVDEEAKTLIFEGKGVLGADVPAPSIASR